MRELANLEDEILYLRYNFITYPSILGGESENFGREISPPNSSEINTAYAATCMQHCYRNVGYQCKYMTSVIGWCSVGVGICCGLRYPELAVHYAKKGISYIHGLLYIC